MRLIGSTAPGASATSTTAPCSTNPFCMSATRCAVRTGSTLPTVGCVRPVHPRRARYTTVCGMNASGDRPGHQTQILPQGRRALNLDVAAQQEGMADDLGLLFDAVVFELLPGL